MKDLKDLFKAVKKVYLINESGIKPTNGILSRAVYKGTNDNDKQTEPRPEEYDKLGDATIRIGAEIVEFGHVLKAKSQEKQGEKITEYGESI